MNKYKVKDICNYNTRSVRGLDKDIEIQYLETSDLTCGECSNLQPILLKNAPSRAQRLLSRDTIVYSMVRPNLCHYGYFENPPQNLVVSTGFLTLNLKPQFIGIIDPRFLYLLLMQPWLTQYLHTIAQNAVSSYPSLNPSDVECLCFEFPDFEVQQRIADLFFKTDRKIALNREINRNLEAMARQLYDYWFVQFDFPDENGRPYKSSGGKMVWNEKLKREIPADWGVCSLGDYVIANNTGDWGYASESDGKTLRVGCIRGADIVKLNDLPIRYLNNGNHSKLLNNWNIVIEVSGGSPVQATGRSAYITPGVIERNGGKITCSNFCHAFTIRNQCDSAFFYYSWQSLYDNRNMFNFESKTSGIKNFMTETFLTIKWPDVPQKVSTQFFAVIESIHAKIDSNITENNSLTALRDELLPLLMNGQVSVKPTSVNCDLSD